MSINQSVWKQKFGVLDAQMNEQPPYAGWLSQDADGDGVNNRNEFIAGTNPFRKAPAEAHFRPPVVSANPTTLSLSFPTVPGKLYGAESNMSLVDTWSKGSLPGVIGDGTSKTLTVPKSAGNFFHITVTDQATQGDQVSDWAKHVLGLSPAAPITSQTSFDSNSLAANLETPERRLVDWRRYLRHPTRRRIDARRRPRADPGHPLGLHAARLRHRPDFKKRNRRRRHRHRATARVADISRRSELARCQNHSAVQRHPDQPRHGFSNSIANPGSAGAGRKLHFGNSRIRRRDDLSCRKSAGHRAHRHLLPGLQLHLLQPVEFRRTRRSDLQLHPDHHHGRHGDDHLFHLGHTRHPYVAGASTALQFTSGNLNIAPFNTLKTYTITTTPTTTSFIGKHHRHQPAELRFRKYQHRWIHLIDHPPRSQSGFQLGLRHAEWKRLCQRGQLLGQMGRLALTHHRGELYLPTRCGRQGACLHRYSGSGTNSTRFSKTAGTPRPPVASNRAPHHSRCPAAPANRYPIRVEFVDTTGSAKCRFQWKLNGGTFANIPVSQCLHRQHGRDRRLERRITFNNPTFTPPAARTQTGIRRHQREQRRLAHRLARSLDLP